MQLFGCGCGCVEGDNLIDSCPVPSYETQLDPEGIGGPSGSSGRSLPGQERFVLLELSFQIAKIDSPVFEAIT